MRSNGELPTRWNTVGRHLTVPVYALTGFAGPPYIFCYAVTDFGSMIFTPGHRRLGDYLGGTRVIKELPDRKWRLDEKGIRDDEDAAKE